MAESMNGLVEAVRGDLVPASGHGPTCSGGTERFELFHSAKSICAQKVRAVFAYHQIPYLGHELNPLVGDNYLPNYVRLRIVGCASSGAAFVTGYDGNTSMTTAGCDPCVVPTLVDWSSDEVIVDSTRICLHVDKQVDEAQKLRPTSLSVDIDRELAEVDNFPNIQMLMSKSPDGRDTAATRLGINGVGFSLSRIEFCKQYMATVPDDQALQSAYAAKIAKETQGAAEVFGAEAVQRAYDHSRAACKGLENKLSERGTPWLFGERVTMADLFWGIELLRLKNLGTAAFWDRDELPHVARYVRAAEELPAIRSALLEWEGALF